MRRPATALAALAVAAGAMAAIFVWQPGLDSLHDDSVSYLIMAQAYSPWHAPDAVIRAALRHEPYPPLFPMLLAVTGGAYDWRIAHLVVAIAFGASVFFFGMHARSVTDSALLGFIAALVYALLPGTWLNAKGILSEFPYMALAFATLVFHARIGARPATRREAIALGALLAAVMLTRMVGVALLAAIAIAEGMRAWRQRDARALGPLALAIGIALICVASWLLLRPAGGRDAYVESGGVMLQGAGEDAVRWLLGSTQVNAHALADAWLAALLIFWDSPFKPAYLLAAALGIFGFGATCLRAVRGHADALYCMIFIAVVLGWPYPGQMYRLAFPIVPLVVVNALWGARGLLALRFDAAGSERGAAYAAILPLAICVPALLFYVVERARMPDSAAVGAGPRMTNMAEFYRLPSGPGARDYAHSQLEVLADMERIRDTTPPGARVMWYTPNYVSLLARRHGVPLRRPGNPAELAAQVRATGADYVYLANIHPRDSHYRQGDPLYPWLLAGGFTDVVWYRGAASTRIQAGLLKVDKEKLMNVASAPR